MPQRLILLLALAFVVASCGDDGDSETRPPDAAGVYTAVIQALAPDLPGAAVKELDRDVFVGPVNDDVELSLGVQASVVEDLEDFATIRFVDDRDEAIGSDETEPVIDDGVLVLLGRVPRGNSPTIRATRYVDIDDVTRFRVTVERSGETWDVTEIERT